MLYVNETAWLESYRSETTPNFCPLDHVKFNTKLSTVETISVVLIWAKDKSLYSHPKLQAIQPQLQPSHILLLYSQKIFTVEQWLGFGSTNLSLLQIIPHSFSFKSLPKSKSFSWIRPTKNPYKKRIVYCHKFFRRNNCRWIEMDRQSRGSRYP